MAAEYHLGGLRLGKIAMACVENDDDESQMGYELRPIGYELCQILF